MRRYCSIPEMFNLRKWFEKNFSNACAMHDKLYEKRELSRLQCDIVLYKYMNDAIKSKNIISKWFIYKPTTILTFIAVRLFGWVRY
jgi:hypothetical protein